MQVERQKSIIQKLLKFRDEKEGQMGQGEIKKNVNVYMDQERLQKEILSVFKQHPLIVAHQSELPNHGSFLAQNLSGVPVLLVRNQEGKIKAYLNVCRHRGTRLLKDKGCISMITCPYHHWFYSLDGKLMGAPHRNGFSEESLNQNLIPLPVEERLGCIWLNLAPNSKMDMNVHLRGMEEELLSFGLDQYICFDKKESKRDINWKLVVDLFLEVYHVRFAHQKTLGKKFLSNIYLYEQIGKHLLLINPKERINRLNPKNMSSWDIRKIANIQYMLFPNVILLLEPHHIDLLLIFPETESSTRLFLYTLIPKEKNSPKKQKLYQFNSDFFSSVIEEDLTIGESIQAGISSGANKYFTFGRFEEPIELFHQQVEESLL